MRRNNRRDLFSLFHDVRVMKLCAFYRTIDINKQLKITLISIGCSLILPVTMLDLDYNKSPIENVKKMTFETNLQMETWALFM